MIYNWSMFKNTLFLDVFLIKIVCFQFDEGSILFLLITHTAPMKEPKHNMEPAIKAAPGN